MTGLRVRERGCWRFPTALTLVLVSLSLGQASRVLLTAEGQLPRCANPPRLDIEAVDTFDVCKEIDQVCVDQGYYILHDPKFLVNNTLDDLLHWKEMPEYEDMNRYPNIKDPKDPVHLENVYDRQPAFRLATQSEHNAAKGKFSECTVPVVFHQSWFHNLGEFLGRPPAWIQRWSPDSPETKTLIQVGRITKPTWSHSNFTIVLAQQHSLPMFAYHKVLLEPFSVYEPLSIQDLSSRLPEHTPSKSTYEGYHIRCFKKMYSCNLDGFATTSIVDVGMKVVEHNRDKLKTEAVQQAVQQVYKKPGQNVLRILFEVRSGSAGTRRILNLDSLLEECNAYDWTEVLQSGEYSWTDVECGKHGFGDIYGDMAVMQETSIYITLHGAGEMNSLFMKPAPFLIELRAKGEVWWENMWWPEISHISNQYIRVFVVSIEGTGLWEPGIFEKLAEETNDPERLESETYKNIDMRHRDRNVYLKLPMLTYSIQRALNTSQLDHQTFKEEFERNRGHNWRFGDDGVVEEYNLF